MSFLNSKNEHLKTFIKPYTGIICLSGFLITIESLAGLSIPKILSHLIDSGTIFKNNPIWWILLLTGLFMIWYICAIWATYYLGSAASRFVRTIRDEMNNNLLRAKMTFHTDGTAGEHLSRLINDVSLLHSIVADHFAQMISSSFIFVGGTVFIVIIDWRLALWLLVLIPIVAFLIKLIGKKLRFANAVCQ